MHNEAKSSWAAENARGHAYASELAAMIEHDENPTVLGKAVKRMIESGQHGGFEVGFFHAIGVRLL